MPGASPSDYSLFRYRNDRSRQRVCHLIEKMPGVGTVPFLGRCVVAGGCALDHVAVPGHDVPADRYGNADYSAQAGLDVVVGVADRQIV
ncbi:hypothetical protein T31B1_05950 [Salinisphaera sp. T31B1]